MRTASIVCVNYLNQVSVSSIVNIAQRKGIQNDDNRSVIPSSNSKVVANGIQEAMEQRRCNSFFSLSDSAWVELKLSAGKRQINPSERCVASMIICTTKVWWDMREIVFVLGESRTLYGGRPIELRFRSTPKTATKRCSKHVSTEWSFYYYSS